MRQYRTAPRAEPRSYVIDPWADNVTVREHLEVYEPRDPWVFTGILGPDGEPMQAYVGTDPVGFLAHLSDG